MGMDKLELSVTDRNRLNCSSLEQATQDHLASNHCATWPVIRDHSTGEHVTHDQGRVLVWRVITFARAVPAQRVHVRLRMLF